MTPKNEVTNVIIISMKGISDTILFCHIFLFLVAIIINSLLAVPGILQLILLLFKCTDTKRYSLQKL